MNIPCDLILDLLPVYHSNSDSNLYERFTPSTDPELYVVNTPSSDPSHQINQCP